jgi:hypothetical protein
MELVLKGRRAFRPYRLRTQRYAVLVAHRRCGKTVACVKGVYLRVEDEELDAIVLSDCGEQGPRRSPRSLTLFS